MLISITRKRERGYIRKLDRNSRENDDIYQWGNRKLSSSIRDVHNWVGFWVTWFGFDNIRTRSKFESVFKICTKFDPKSIPFHFSDSNLIIQHLFGSGYQVPFTILPLTLLII